VCEKRDKEKHKKIWIPEEFFVFFKETETCTLKCLDGL